MLTFKRNAVGRIGVLMVCNCPDLMHPSAVLVSLNCGRDWCLDESSSAQKGGREEDISEGLEQKEKRRESGIYLFIYLFIFKFVFFF